MMNFEKAFKLVIGAEGGYSNDPTDPGNWTGGARGKGELMGTKFGIAANTYGKKLKAQGKTIKNLTLADAQEIYKRDWWDKLQCDDLPDKFRYPLFSAAINCGISRAVKWLQESIDAKPDGVLGPKTIAAACATNQGVGLHHFYDYWLAYYTSLAMHNPSQKKFLKGWQNRVSEVKKNNI